MCGLYGFINRGNNKINHTNLVRGMAISAMSRGKHATGVSYNAGGTLCTIKAATPADKFVFNIPKPVSAVIGHTRHTTQGSELKNYNNHPFQGVGGRTMFALAHNGVLDNDYELQYTEDLPKTNIETDSYVAVQLLEKYSFDDSMLTLDSIRKMSEIVSGMFAFSILDSKNQFWLVRNDSPIHMVYFKKLNLYVYASTEAIVKEGLKKAGLNQKYQVIDVPMESIVHIDLNGELSMFTFKAVERLSWYNPKYAVANGGYYSSPSYQDYYHKEDDVRLELYDYGYSDDEFELLVSDYGLNEVIEAIDSGTVQDLLLDSLRRYYLENVSNTGVTVPYVSPIYR